MKLVDKIDRFLTEKEETRAELRRRKFKPVGDSGLEKSGGKRKRRSAYSSGRREIVFDMKRKRFLDSKSDIKKQLGISQKKIKGCLSGTGMRSKHRWKRY